VSTYKLLCHTAMDAGVSSGYGGSMGMGGSTGVAPGAGGAAGSGSTSATEYSTTNTQVASVDEADYSRTTATPSSCCRATACHVIDAWPAGENPPRSRT